MKKLILISNILIWFAIFSFFTLIINYKLTTPKIELNKDGTFDYIHSDEPLAITGNYSDEIFMSEINLLTENHTDPTSVYEVNHIEHLPNDTIVNVTAEESSNFPTEFWDISENGIYTPEFENIENYAFTNYYFSPDDTGSLFITTDHINNNINVVYSVWEYESSQKIASYSPVKSGTDLFIEGLDNSKHYFIEYEVIDKSQPISGSSSISHILY